MQNDIIRQVSDNIGSVIAFEFLEIKGVSVIPPTVRATIWNAVELVDGYRWQKGYGTEGTMSFKDEPANSENGGYHKKIFSANVPKDRPEINDLFNSMQNKKFILQIMDANGLKKLIGTIDEPLTFKSGYDTKANFQGRAEYQISFEGEGVDKSPFYNV